MTDPSSVDPSAPRRRGLWFWFAVVGGLGLLCCGGIGAAVWSGAREWIDIAAAPESERADLLSKKLEQFAGDRVRVADEFLAAVDADRGDDAWAMTSQTFQSAVVREKFDELRHSVTTVMGPLVSRRVTNVNTRKTIGSGDSTTLVLQGTFEKGQGTITLELEGSEPDWKIRSWNTQSPLFLQAIERGAEPDEK